MNLFNVVFQSVLSLIGIGVLGFWILKRGIIPENVIGILSRLAIDIALPSVIFAGILLNFDPRKVPDWWQLPLWWLGFTGVALIFTLLTMFLARRTTRGEFAMSLLFQNGLFFPLILIIGMYGADSPYAAQLFIFILFHPVLFFTTSHLFFRKRAGENRQPQLNLERIINPILVATVLAVAVRLTGLETYLPDFLIKMLTMVGGMTAPLIMIILGGSLYIDFQKKGKIHYGEIAKFVLIKNLFFPLAFLGLLVLLRPAYHIALIVLLQSAVPPITGVPIFVEREGGNRSIANQFILASFLGSILTIPLIFTLFNRFFPLP